MIGILVELGFGLGVITIIAIYGPMVFISKVDIRVIIVYSGLIGMATGWAAGMLYRHEYPVKK